LPTRHHKRKAPTGGAFLSCLVSGRQLAALTATTLAAALTAAALTAAAFAATLATALAAALAAAASALAAATTLAAALTAAALFRLPDRHTICLLRSEWMVNDAFLAPSGPKTWPRTCEQINI
jgi:hypothetical protein